MILFQFCVHQLDVQEQEVHPSPCDAIMTLYHHSLGQQCAGYFGNGWLLDDFAALTRPDRLTVGDEAMFSLLFELLANFA